MITLVRWCYEPSLLKTFDALLSCFVVFPAVIVFWSGTWRFLDLYFFPHDRYVGAILMLMISKFVIMCGYFALPILEEVVELEDLQRDFTKHLVVSKVFNYVIAMAFVFAWKGIWNLTELVFGKSLEASVIITCTSLVALLLMKCVATAETSPFTLNLDIAPDFYKTRTRFQTQLRPDCILLYSLDVLFTCLIIQPLSVMSWVGLWNLCEHLLCPNDHQLSLYISAGIGITGTLILFLLQRFNHYAASQLREVHPFLSQLFCSYSHLVTVVFGLLLWRGCWGYIDLYVLLDSRTTLIVTFHVFGMLLLMFLQVSRTAALLRCSVDSELEFDVKFFQHYWRFQPAQPNLQVINILCSKLGVF